MLRLVSGIVMLSKASKGRYVLYDFLQVSGGAEKITFEFAEMLEGFQIVVSRTFRPASNLGSSQEILVNQLGNCFTRILGRVMESLFCFAVSAASIRSAEAVIYSGIYAPLAVLRQRSGAKIYYCHTPPRFLSDLKEEYRSRMPFFLLPLWKVFLICYGWAYRLSLKRMDVVFANSENVRLRLREYFHVESTVLYPPVNTEGFKWVSDNESFVSMARLEPLKRVDLIVRAFKEMPDLSLVVLSGGSQLEYLKGLAKDVPNIRFVGWVSEEVYKAIVGNARACIYIPVNEDLGLGPLEAMSAGKPTITVAEGGCIETVSSPELGYILAADPSIEEIKLAVRSYSRTSSPEEREARESRAAEFSREAFRKRLLSCAQLMKYVKPR
jgi:glycosyltransferase involved in cell wall biosynthesis